MIFTLLLLHEPMILLCGIAKKFNLSHAFSPQWVLRAINHIVRDKSQAARDTNQDAHNATHVATETWRHAAVYSLFCGAFFLKFPLSKIWSLLSFSSEGNITKLSCYNNALNPLSLKTEPVNVPHLTCSMTSGAIQQGVPTNVLRTFGLDLSPKSLMTELTPKSANTNWS